VDPSVRRPGVHPDGHRTISPGVVRQVNNAIKAATKPADDDKKGEDE
jgi:hypothetical protein